jgi:hypothetical protein
MVPVYFAVSMYYVRETETPLSFQCQEISSVSNALPVPASKEGR